MPNKEQTKTSVHYEIRYKSENRDRPGKASKTHERLHSVDDKGALAEFKGFGGASESRHAYKLFKITRVVRTYPKKRVITITERCMTDAEI